VSSQATAKSSTLIERAYAVAREQYAAVGVDVERALERLRTVPLSIHCWQGDDVVLQFARALEAQSAGRKLLLRMGPGNAARVQAKLKEIRDRIAAPAT